MNKWLDGLSEVNIVSTCIDKMTLIILGSETNGKSGFSSLLFVADIHNDDETAVVPLVKNK